MLLLAITYTSPGESSVFRVVHEVTNTEQDFTFASGYGPPIFDLETGPEHVILSFLIDTIDGPEYECLEGQNIPGSGRIVLNDFYGYPATSISEFSVSFGRMSWDESHLHEQYFYVGATGVWFDELPAIGATPNILISLKNIPEHWISFGWPYGEAALLECTRTAEATSLTDIRRYAPPAQTPWSRYVSLFRQQQPLFFLARYCSV